MGSSPHRSSHGQREQRSHHPPALGSRRPPAGLPARPLQSRTAAGTHPRLGRTWPATPQPARATAPRQRPPQAPSPALACAATAHPAERTPAARTHTRAASWCLSTGTAHPAPGTLHHRAPSGLPCRASRTRAQSLPAHPRPPRPGQPQTTAGFRQALGSAQSPPRPGGQATADPTPPVWATPLPTWPQRPPQPPPHGGGSGPLKHVPGAPNRLHGAFAHPEPVPHPATATSSPHTAPAVPGAPWHAACPQPRKRSVPAPEGDGVPSRGTADQAGAIPSQRTETPSPEALLRLTEPGPAAIARRPAAARCQPPRSAGARP